MFATIMVFCTYVLRRHSTYNMFTQISEYGCSKYNIYMNRYCRNTGSTKYYGLMFLVFNPAVLMIRVSFQEPCEV